MEQYNNTQEKKKHRTQPYRAFVDVRKKSVLKQTKLIEFQSQNENKIAEKYTYK